MPRHLAWCRQKGCSAGRVYRAYIRRGGRGQQRWIEIGGYCVKCGAFQWLELPEGKRGGA